MREKREERNFFGHVSWEEFSHKRLEEREREKERQRGSEEEEVR